MTKDIVQKAVGLAEKELREKQVDEVKKIVLKTLEKLEEKKKQRGELDEEIKLLKLDIDDLKAGKLDRIVERQEKDEKAKKTSVVTIIKEKVVHTHDPWYWPYRYYWNPVVTTTPCYASMGNIGLCTTAVATTDQILTAEATTSSNSYLNVTDGSGGAGGSGAIYMSTINCSVAKDAAIGCYEVDSKIVNLR